MKYTTIGLIYTMIIVPNLFALEDNVKNKLSSSSIIFPGNLNNNQDIHFGSIETENKAVQAKEDLRNGMSAPLKERKKQQDNKFIFGHFLAERIKAIEQLVKQANEEKSDTLIKLNNLLTKYGAERENEWRFNEIKQMMQNQFSAQEKQWLINNETPTQEQIFSTKVDIALQVMKQKNKRIFASVYLE